MAPGSKPRVFLDTNVIFSGLYSSKGAPGKILELFIKGEIEVVVSQQVLDEVVRTVKDKLPEALPALNALLVNNPPEVVPAPEIEYIKQRPGVLSLADAAILAAVRASQTYIFITGDRHFFKSNILLGTGMEIITPATFLKIYLSPR
jgi:putative PIN family toxin of toxin-antitoxin system